MSAFRTALTRAAPRAATGTAPRATASARTAGLGLGKRPPPLPEYVPVPPARARVLYVDNHLLAVDKPPHVLAQPDMTGALSLPVAIEEFLVRNLGKPGRAYVGVLHRLDRPCSGVTLFARTSKAAARVAEAFRTGNMDKVYFAAVSPPPPREAGVLSPVQANESPLTYRVIRRVQRDDAAVLALRISTGKRHQVRRTLAEHGHPIVGDEFHGSKHRVPAGCRRDSVMLHAAQLAFAHPVTGRAIKIRSTPPWPSEYLPMSFKHVGVREGGDRAEDGEGGPGGRGRSRTRGPGRRGAGGVGGGLARGARGEGDAPSGEEPRKHATTSGERKPERGRVRSARARGGAVAKAPPPSSS